MLTYFISHVEHILPTIIRFLEDWHINYDEHGRHNTDKETTTQNSWLHIYRETNEERARLTDDWRMILTIAVPITVKKQPPSGPESRVLRRIRHKVDKSHVRELDFSIQQDLSQDVKIPNGCRDRYSIRDGVIKHLLRGGRDVIVAAFRDVQDLINYNVGGIPLAPNIVNGVSKAITDILCGGEEAASDFANYFDTLTDLITRFLLDFLEFRGMGTLLSEYEILFLRFTL
ncbi:hypothetical protein TNCV_813101 [Trichonephila clavipes]|nr:hypothetical protein TNCV_813101 [Trichonephila clavipes]